MAAALVAAGERLPLLFIDVDKGQHSPPAAAKAYPKAKAESAARKAASLVQNNRIPAIVLYYSFCSSTLIVINKVAVHNIAAPVFILVLQLLFAAAVVKALSLSGAVQADALQWRLIKPFLPFVASFLGTIFANIKVLEHSNVETFITFRSSTPLVLSLCEFLMLGRELPRGRSVLGMVLPLVACAGYTYFDQGFKVQAYTWLLVWYAFFLFDALYVKYMCDTVPMTNWGRVYYTNVISGCVLLAVLPFCPQEHSVIRQLSFSTWQAALLLLSCLVGVGMSHATFLTRSSVSATAGVVIGVVCKLGSVLLNLAIWEHHASPIQLFFLTMGLVGGSLFQQAPMRPNWQYKQQQAAANNKAVHHHAPAVPDLQPDLEISSPVSSGGPLADSECAAGEEVSVPATNTGGQHISGAQAGALADLQQLASVWTLGARSQWPGGGLQKWQARLPTAAGLVETLREVQGYRSAAAY